MAETKTRTRNETAAPYGGRKMRKLETNFVIIDDSKEPNHADHAEGTLVQIDSQTFPGSGNSGPQTVGRYTLTDDNGKTVTVLGSTSMDAVLGQVPTGTYVAIKFDGYTRSRGGREVKQYDIQVAD